MDSALVFINGMWSDDYCHSWFNSDNRYHIRMVVQRTDVDRYQDFRSFGEIAILHH